MNLNGSKFAQKIPQLQIMTLCLHLPSWLCKSHFFNPLVSPKQPYKLITLCCSKSDEVKDANTSKEIKKLSQQSSWEAQDSEGKDYLYRLGAEADNMNIAIGARAGVIDDLFTGNFLGKDCNLFFSSSILCYYTLETMFWGLELRFVNWDYVNWLRNLLGCEEFGNWISGSSLCILKYCWNLKWSLIYNHLA